MFVAVLEFPANPSEAVPSPAGAVIRFAKAVDAASALQAMRDVFGRVVRLADDLDHLSSGNFSSTRLDSTIPIASANTFTALFNFTLRNQSNTCSLSNFFSLLSMFSPAIHCHPAPAAKESAGPRRELQIILGVERNPSPSR